MASLKTFKEFTMTQLGLRFHPKTNIPFGLQMGTCDYSIFQSHELNRVDFDAPARGDLVASMKKYGYQKEHPIKCSVSENGTLIVFAGHNRLNAAKALGLPVEYVVYDTTMSPDVESSGVKVWTISDHFTAHAKKGNLDCVEILNFAKQNRITNVVGYLLLNGRIPHSSIGRLDNQRLIDGYASINPAHRQYAENVIEIADSIAVNCPHLGISRSSSLFIAIARICAVDKFCVLRIIEKINRNPELVRKHQLSQDYVVMFDLIYNRHQKVGRIDLVALVKGEVTFKSHGARKAARALRE